MDKIITIIASLGLIGVILWWFFGKHQATTYEAASAGNLQTADITVQGGYNPAVVTLRAGIPARLTFLRKDSSSCLEEVVIPHFGVSEKLPVNQPHSITITPTKTGEFAYSCGMRMYHGKLIVR